MLGEGKLITTITDTQQKQGPPYECHDYTHRD